jgi:glutathione peroxidase
MNKKTIYDYSFTSISGKEIQLEEYRDHVLLVVNTASKCGFTPQLKSLEKLYQNYKNRKFTVIGFPCNQFQNQDPGTNEEIQEFCSINYGVTFPLSEKVDVNGSNTHPLFHFLKSQSPGIFGIKKIKWNFTKFLVDRKGNVIKRFSPYIKPSQISSYIDKLIQIK